MNANTQHRAVTSIPLEEEESSESFRAVDPLNRARKEIERPLVEALKPSELMAWEMPKGYVLLGDCHITRGEVFVIGGTQGVGKSKATAGLAVAGATGQDWMGYQVRCKFKTLIVQNENGSLRLKEELLAVTTEAGVDLDHSVRITPPPINGLAFNDPNFRAQLRAIIDDFNPDVVVIDPWNAVASDDKQKDYAEAFQFIRQVCGVGPDSPAVGIVAHLRKPGLNDKRGRGGMHRLSGSYLLASIPRCIFILESATDDVTDDRVVLTCPKCSNGRNGDRTDRRLENWPKTSERI